MLCPIEVNSNTIELTVHTSCYWVLDLLCYLMSGFQMVWLYHLNTGHKMVQFQDVSGFWLSGVWIVTVSQTFLKFHDLTHLLFRRFTKSPRFFPTCYPEDLATLEEDEFVDDMHRFQDPSISYDKEKQ